MRQHISGVVLVNTFLRIASLLFDHRLETGLHDSPAGSRCHTVTVPDGVAPGFIPGVSATHKGWRYKLKHTVRVANAVAGFKGRRGDMESAVSSGCRHGGIRLPHRFIGMRTKHQAALLLSANRAWYKISFAATQRQTRTLRRTQAGSGASPPPKLDCRLNMRSISTRSR